MSEGEQTPPSSPAGKRRTLRAAILAVAALLVCAAGYTVATDPYYSMAYRRWRYGAGASASAPGGGFGSGPAVQHRRAAGSPGGRSGKPRRARNRASNVPQP